MKCLLTLDFPPRKGGIQRYLLSIVRHTMTAQDCVIVGGWGVDGATRSACSARIWCVGRALAGVHQKWALLAVAGAWVSVRMSVRMSLFSRGAGDETWCGNIYAALVPWFFSWVIVTPYAVFTYGTELLVLRHHSFKARILRSALNRASCVYVLGRYTETLVRDGGVTTPTTLLHPKLERSFVDNAEKVERGVNPVMVLLVVGRLVDHKGHRFAIEALALLAVSCAVRLIIAGDGPCHDALVALSEQRGVASMVTMIRNLADSDIHALYASADYCLVPSIESPKGSEGFGIVLLEAMAYRVPIIAAATGGIPQVLDEGRCGVLVPAGSAEAIADAVRALVRDPERTRTMTRTAYDHLRNHYVWD